MAIVRQFVISGIVMILASGSALAQCSPSVCLVSGPSGVGYPVIVDSTMNTAANVSPAPGGILSSLNAPIVPGLPAVPGLPTISPLGLIAPRASFATSFFQNGGLATPGNGLNLLGLVAPRLAPAVGLLQGGVPTPTVGFQQGLAIVSPRLAVGTQLLRAAPGVGLFPGSSLRRCR